MTAKLVCALKTAIESNARKQYSAFTCDAKVLIKLFDLEAK